jgi:hypothetical protein
MKVSRKVLLTIAAGAALVTTVPAFAQNWNHRYGHPHHRGVAPLYYAPPRVVYAPPPLYYRPRQVIYAPAAYYYGPRVVYARPGWHRGHRR